MDLALNQLQRLICHKTQPIKHPTKVKVIIQLEYEFAYKNVGVQHVRHYATEAPPIRFKYLFLINTSKL